VEERKTLATVRPAYRGGEREEREIKKENEKRTTGKDMLYACTGKEQQEALAGPCTSNILCSLLLLVPLLVSGCHVVVFLLLFFGERLPEGSQFGRNVLIRVVSETSFYVLNGLRPGSLTEEDVGRTRLLRGVRIALCPLSAVMRLAG